MESIFKIAYITIKEANDNFINYVDWLKSIDDVMSDITWIKDVIEVAISPFSRSLQNSNK